MSLILFDVSTAFLYGKIEEDVFMKKPEGYEDGSDRVCHLKRSLYGLNQAPRCWNKRFEGFVIKQGVPKRATDHCLFIKKKGENINLLALYVDDGLLTSNSQSFIKDFMRILKNEFKITVKLTSCFLCLEIERNGNGWLE